MHTDVASVDQNAPEIDESALQVKNILHRFRRRVVHDLVFQVVDSVIDLIRGGKVRIDNGIEQPVKDLVGAVRRSQALAACQGLSHYARFAVRDSDTEVTADKDIEVWKVQLAVGHCLHWLQNHEEVFGALFDLGALAA